VFQLGDTLGTGTFGRVRIVTYSPPTAAAGSDPDAPPAKPLYFALKMLKKSEIIRLKQVEHIKAEKQILSRISHPFIVNLYTAFQDERNLYLGLEYVLGGELFSQLRKVGRFSNEVARFYAAEITMALAYLHSLDICYRDLKPENLLISASGHIKITDFGFAKVVEDRTWTLCGSQNTSRTQQSMEQRSSCWEMACGSACLLCARSALFCVLHIFSSRVPGSRDHSVEGSRQGRGLVGAGHSDFRDAGRLPSVLRRKPVRHLPEDSEGSHRVPQAYGPPRQGPHQEAAHGRPHQEIRVPAARSGRHQV